MRLLTVKDLRRSLLTWKQQKTEFKYFFLLKEICRNYRKRVSFTQNCAWVFEICSRAFFDFSSDLKKSLETTEFHVGLFPRWFLQSFLDLAESSFLVQANLVGAYFILKRPRT